VNKDRPAKIKVMIANDHPIMRVGLRLAVRRERDMEIVGETKARARPLKSFSDCYRTSSFWTSIR
jgi:DNA-binding NarL/FixJ family response regulator